MGDGTLGGSAAPAFDERALEDCATRNPSRFGFAEAARRRLSDKSDRILVGSRRQGINAKVISRSDFVWGCAALVAALPSAARAEAGRGAWSLAAPLPTERSEDSVAAIGTVLYVVGGYVPAGPNPKFLEVNGRADVDGALVQAYDAVANAWQQRASLPSGLNHIGVVEFGGKLFTFGGFERQNRGAVADANVYDAAADRWAPIAPVPTRRGSIAVAALGANIHLVGGRDEHSVGTHDVYDVAANTYASARPLPIGRDHMGLIAFDGHLYAIAGRIDDFDHNTSFVDMYDPATDTWAALAAMPSQRSGMAVAVYRDQIFALGGERRGGTFTNNEAFDPRLNTWGVFAPLPEGRHGTGAVVIRDAIYLPAGGPVNGGSRQSTTLYVFRLD
jgi:N-acetylneuraminic acid mutarotase